MKNRLFSGEFDGYISGIEDKLSTPYPRPNIGIKLLKSPTKPQHYFLFSRCSDCPNSLLYMPQTLLPPASTGYCPCAEYSLFCPCKLYQLPIDDRCQSTDRYPFLRHGIPITNRNCLIFFALVVYSHAEGSADGIHPAVSLPDGILLFVKTPEMRFAGIHNLAGNF